MRCNADVWCAVTHGQHAIAQQRYGPVFASWLGRTTNWERARVEQVLGIPPPLMAPFVATVHAMPDINEWFRSPEYSKLIKHAHVLMQLRRIVDAHVDGLESKSLSDEAIRRHARHVANELAAHNTEDDVTLEMLAGAYCYNLSRAPPDVHAQILNMVEPMAVTTEARK